MARRNASAVHDVENDNDHQKTGKNWNKKMKKRIRNFCCKLQLMIWKFTLNDTIVEYPKTKNSLEKLG